MEETTYWTGPEDMLTVGEAARILHVHPNTLRRWADSGIIRSFRNPERGDRQFQRYDVIRQIRGMRINNGRPADSSYETDQDSRSRPGQ